MYAVVAGLLLPSRLAVPAEEVFYGDADHYSTLAVNMLQKGMYSLDGVQPFFEREPGYSLFLVPVYAIFGVENRAAVYLIQALIYACAVVVFCREFRRIAGGRAGLLCTAMLLFFPAALHAVFSPLREVIALSLLLCMCTGCLRLIRERSWMVTLLTGLSLGLLMLTYAPFLLLPFFLLVALPLIRVPWRYAVVSLLVAAACMGVWGARNYAHKGELCLTGCYRAALQWHVRGEQAQTIRGLEPLRCLYAEYISRDWTGLDANCSFNAVWHRRWPDGFVGVPADRRIAQDGQVKILQYFPHYLWFSVFEVLELHLPYVNGWGFAYNVLAAGTTVLLYIGVLLWLVSRRWKREYILFLALMAYTTGLFSLTDTTPRYLLPVIFCYGAFAAAGFGWLAEKYYGKSIQG